MQVRGLHSPQLSNVMELSLFDLEQISKVAAIVKKACIDIEQITGSPADLRLHQPLPKRKLKEPDVLVNLIISMVCDRFCVKPEDVKGPSRKRPLPDARGVAMYAIKQKLGIDLGTIGLHFGGRDHSTVSTRIKEMLNTAKFDINLTEIINHVTVMVEMISIYDEPGTNTTT